LHATQQIAHDSKARFKVLKNGRRWGKTVLEIFELLQAAGGTPNGIFWYVAPTYGQAKEIAWSLLKRITPKNLLRKNPSESELSVELWNGSIIKLKGSDYPESLKGVPLDGCVMDEAAFQEEVVWTEILRPQLMDKKGFCHFISTPRGTNWFTSLFNEARRKKDKGDTDWDYFHFTTFDNPFIDKAEIELSRETMPEDKFNQEVLAIESEDVGLQFPEFDYTKNTGLYLGDGTLMKVRAVDWGIAHPTVCLFGAMDLNEKKLYIYDEYVKSGALIKESAAAINTISGSDKVEWTVIDPSCSKRNSQTNRRDMDEFARYGVHCIPADNKDRGYDITRMFLKLGIIKINPKCKTLIYQLRNLNRGDDTGDDVTDCLRYMCVRIHDFVYGMNIHDVQNDLKVVNDGDKIELRQNKWTMSQVKMAMDEGSGRSMNWVKQHIATL
jgi:hypothetical protein